MTIPPVQVYDELPPGFSPEVEVAAVYVNVGSKILLLQLSPLKHEEGKWGVPCGKLETDEKPIEAAKRELFEEVGIRLGLEALRPLGKLYMRKPHLDYIYHFFDLNFDAPPSVYLSDEHCAYTWASLEEAFALPLMGGGKEALEAYARME